DAPAGGTAPYTYIWAVGPLGGTVPIQQFPKDTPLIQPGQSAAIVYDEPGVFYMHCHPHPWMRSNVTILDNKQPPQTVTVHFVDGLALSDYRFWPSEVV